MAGGKTAMGVGTSKFGDEASMGSEAWGRSATRPSQANMIEARQARGARRQSERMETFEAQHWKGRLRSCMKVSRMAEDPRLRAMVGKGQFVDDAQCHAS
jgi:hypothetical protein